MAVPSPLTKRSHSLEAAAEEEEIVAADVVAVQETESALNATSRGILPESAHLEMEVAGGKRTGTVAEAVAEETVMGAVMVAGLTAEVTVMEAVAAEENVTGGSDLGRMNAMEGEVGLEAEEGTALKSEC